MGNRFRNWNNFGIFRGLGESVGGMVSKIIKAQHKKPTVLSKLRRSPDRKPTTTWLVVTVANR